MALARAIAVRPTRAAARRAADRARRQAARVLRVEIDELLRRLRITAVYVTHDQPEAMALGDRIVVMEHGRVAQIGTPRDIYLAPGHPLRRRLRRHREPPRAAQAIERAWCLPAPAIACPPDWMTTRPCCSGPKTSAGRGGPAALDGPVGQRTFLGDRVRLRLSLPDQPGLLADAVATRPSRLATPSASAPNPAAS